MDFFRVSDKVRVDKFFLKPLFSSAFSSVVAFPSPFHIKLLSSLTLALTALALMTEHYSFDTRKVPLVALQTLVSGVQFDGVAAVVVESEGIESDN